MNYIMSLQHDMFMKNQCITYSINLKRKYKKRSKLVFLLRVFHIISIKMVNVTNPSALLLKQFFFHRQLTLKQAELIVLCF